MTTQFETAGFAVVQTGYAVFGVGETEDAAWAHAALFAEDLDGLVCMPATAAAIAEVRDAGGGEGAEFLGVLVSEAEYKAAMADEEPSVAELQALIDARVRAATGGK